MAEIRAARQPYDFDTLDALIPTLAGKVNGHKPFAGGFAPYADKSDNYHLPVSGYTFDAAASKELVFAEPLIEGVMDKGEIAYFFGESGCMKSFVLCDFALHVAMGWDWCGFKGDGRKKGVAVVVAEGQAGYPKRIKAQKNYYKVDRVPIFVVPEPVALDTDAGKLAVWINEAEQILGIKIDLVVLDTYSLMLGNGEENSNRDITIASNNVRQALDGRAGAFVHHTGHGDKTRERGAYQIRANADVRILISRDDDNKGRVITVENVKQKDRELFPSFNLTYHQVEVGERHGKPVTSLVMVPTDLDPTRPKSERSTRVLDYVQQAILVTGSNQREVVRQQFYALYPVKGLDKEKDDEARRKAFARGWKEYQELCTSKTEDE